MFTYYTVHKVNFYTFIIHIYTYKRRLFTSNGDGLLLNTQNLLDLITLFLQLNKKKKKI